MVGVRVRVHDLDANDLGIAHVPLPLAVGDLVATEHHEFRVVDFILSPPGSPVGALARVRPVRLPDRGSLTPGYLRIEERELEAGGRSASLCSDPSLPGCSRQRKTAAVSLERVNFAPKRMYCTRRRP
jgi:hypothetical protein